MSTQSGQVQFIKVYMSVCSMKLLMSCCPPYLNVLILLLVGHHQVLYLFLHPVDHEVHVLSLSLQVFHVKIVGRFQLLLMNQNAGF